MASKEYFINRKQSPMEVFAIANGTSATANKTTDTISLAGKSLALGNLSFQVIGTGLDAADAIVKTQHSNDGKTWDDVSGSSLTLASGTTTQTIVMVGISFTFYRVVYSKGSNTTGTIQVSLKFA